MVPRPRIGAGQSQRPAPSSSRSQPQPLNFAVGPPGHCGAATETSPEAGFGKAALSWVPFLPLLPLSGLPAAGVWHHGRHVPVCVSKETTPVRSPKLAASSFLSELFGEGGRGDGEGPPLAESEEGAASEQSRGPWMKAGCGLKPSWMRGGVSRARERGTESLLGGFCWQLGAPPLGARGL